VERPVDPSGKACQLSRSSARKRRKQDDRTPEEGAGKYGTICCPGRAHDVEREFGKNGLSRVWAAALNVAMNIDENPSNVKAVQLLFTGGGGIFFRNFLTVEPFMPSSSAHPARFTVGLIQMAVAADPADNLRKAASRVEEAARRGAQVVCLPELYRSHYFCQREDVAMFDLAETVPGPSTEAFAEIARRLGVAIVVPVFERRSSGVYHNSAAVLDADGSTLGLYRKMHIPDDPSYYEKFYFTPGDLGFKSFPTRFGSIGTLICWDQWFPEAARLTAMQGPSVIFYPTAIGWHPHEKAQHGSAQREAWRTVQRGHAVANGIYVAAVNRIGHEVALPGSLGIEFWGSSFIADPQGVIVAEASTDREEILVAEIDLARIDDVRRNWPFFRDRRIGAYGGITQRWGELP